MFLLFGFSPTLEKKKRKLCISLCTTMYVMPCSMASRFYNEFKMSISILWYFLSIFCYYKRTIHYVKKVDQQFAHTLSVVIFIVRVQR